jgi:hypothetical protein
MRLRIGRVDGDGAAGEVRDREARLAAVRPRTDPMPAPASTRDDHLRNLRQAFDPANSLQSAPCDVKQTDDLPIVQPTRFALALHHGSARALGWQCWRAHRRFRRLLAYALATRASTLARNSFNTFDVLALLYPTTRSTVGASPLIGRLVTDEGR